MSNWFLSKLALFVLHDGICGSFHNKAAINAFRTALCIMTKTWMKTVLTCFTEMIAEQPSLTQYERPMYHYERKINMLSRTDNNVMICILDFEKFSIESRFPF